MILWLCQVLFGTAALVSTGMAAWSVARLGHRGAAYLCVAGVCSLIFFLTVPEVLPELVAVSVLAIIAGVVLMPIETRQHSHDSFNDNDLEVGETTARRLKR